MGAVAVNRLHLRPHAVLFAKNAHLLVAIQNATAQCVFGLEADEEDGVRCIADVVLEMMQDTPRLAHARRADDDRRIAQKVEGLGILYITDVAQPSEAEGVAV